MSKGITEEMMGTKVKKKPHPGKGEQVPGFILLTAEEESSSES